ncbi:hypothetical protein NFI96_003082 [Prochilodus magdalenae]|nr:hypothetical protein NFI96_003082 [Prochilodus magdalenae]
MGVHTLCVDVQGLMPGMITKTFGPSSSYVVEGLRANTEYQFSLAAVSKKGIGAFTNEVTQKTSQAKEVQPATALGVQQQRTLFVLDCTCPAVLSGEGCNLHHRAESTTPDAPCPPKTESSLNGQQVSGH